VPAAFLKLQLARQTIAGSLLFRTIHSPEFPFRQIIEVLEGNSAHPNF